MRRDEYFPKVGLKMSLSLSASQAIDNTSAFRDMEIDATAHSHATDGSKADIPFDEKAGGRTIYVTCMDSTWALLTNWR
jgi:hypothetical protein